MVLNKMETKSVYMDYADVSTGQIDAKKGPQVKKMGSL
jgi:hypothetical protein